MPIAKSKNFNSELYMLVRYCLFGLDVALTEKFESNSLPMKIHISETCKDLLTPQYKVEERNEEGLPEKVSRYLKCVA